MGVRDCVCVFCSGFGSLEEDIGCVCVCSCLYVCAVACEGCWGCGLGPLEGDVACVSVCVCVHTYARQHSTKGHRLETMMSGRGFKCAVNGQWMACVMSTQNRRESQKLLSHLKSISLNVYTQPLK